MRKTNDPQEALQWIEDAPNVFLTGAAGCGKTYLMRQWLKSKPFAALTATTGVAALYKKREISCSYF